MKHDRAPRDGSETGGAPQPGRGLKQRIDAFFGITAAGSDFKREVVAGLTTFMAMVYILMANSEMFAKVIPAENAAAAYGAAYLATAIGAVAGTMLMAFYAKMPLVQASGMGINAFIVYTLILGGTGLSYANCMAITLINGVLFLILTLTGIRKKIFDAIPAGIRHAIPIGLGLFIAFVGLQDAGVITDDPSTLVALVSFNLLGDNSYASMIGALVALLGVVAIAAFAKKGVKGGLFWGILGSTALYYALTGIGAACGSAACREFYASFSISDPFSAFSAWWKYSAGAVFTQGFDFGAYLGMEGNNAGTLIVLLLTSELSLCMIDMFDTMGTLYGACTKGNLLDENGVPIRMERMMLTDSMATCVAAAAGTSTIITFVESSSGVAAGGKTGLTAFTAGLLFLAAMFLSPIARLIPAPATAGALIWIGVQMMSSVTKIDWEDPADAVVAFLTFLMMLLSYSIAKGIGIGVLAYLLVMLFTGRVKEVPVATYLIGALFLATFLLT